MLTRGCRVFEIQRFSLHDGPGIRTTVFLEGCPLRCAWCQNPEAFETGRAPLRSPSEVIAEVLADADYYAVSGGGLTVSGGEPLLHREVVCELLDEARRHRLHTCVQTCGAVPEANVAAVLGQVDLFQFDLKHMDPARHRALTGAGVERIHRNAAFLLERGAAVEFRMPLVPGVNDDPANLDRVARFLTGLGVPRLSLLPYHRLYLEKYVTLGRPATMRAVEPPSGAVLGSAIAHLQAQGVAVDCG